MNDERLWMVAVDKVTIMPMVSWCSAWGLMWSTNLILNKIYYLINNRKEVDMPVLRVVFFLSNW